MQAPPSLYHCRCHLHHHNSFGDRLRRRHRLCLWRQSLQENSATHPSHFYDRILDVGRNASIVLTKASCQAFLIDLASRDERKIRLANMFSTFFMAVGNLMGYFSAFVNYENTFPFTETKACHSDYYIWVKCVLFLSIILHFPLTCLLINIFFYIFAAVSSNSAARIFLCVTTSDALFSTISSELIQAVDY
ncbi:hypothetical protein AHAS_Ahas17G0247000 [Arachis hypogaea]